MKCDCISSNRPMPYQKTPNVVLVPPFPSKPVGGPEIPHRSVCIDACIAPTIKHLWERGIYTLNSCCGHNGLFREGAGPEVIVDQNCSRERADTIRRIIAEVDDREWKVLSWVLTEV